MSIYDKVEQLLNVLEKMMERDGDAAGLMWLDDASAQVKDVREWLVHIRAISATMTKSKRGGVL